MAVKNQALTVTFSVVDASTGMGKTGDAGNLTMRLVGDGAEITPAAAPAEVDAANAPGTYKIALAAAEMNYDFVRLTGKSSTANVVVIPVDIQTAPFTFTTSGVNNFVRADIQAIAGSNSGDSYFLHNMVQDYGLHNSKIPAVVSDVVTAKIGNGHIPIIASIRSDDRYMVAAQFTKAGVAVQPSSAPTCAADCIVVSDDYPTGHTFNYGTLSLQYNSTTKSYYAFGVLASAIVGNRTGLLICKFHTDDATVDAQDVTVAVAVNMERYNPDLVEPVLASIKSRTDYLGAMTVTVQSPMVTAKSFKLIQGDTYGLAGNGFVANTAIERPITFRVDGVPFSISNLIKRVFLKYTRASNASVITVVKSDIVITNVKGNGFDLLIPFSDEETRDMAKQENATWEFKVFEAAGLNNWNDATLMSGTFSVDLPVYDGLRGPDNDANLALS